MEKDPTLFTFLGQIQSKIRKYPYNKKLAPSYMLLMWLSHVNNFLPIIEKINTFNMKDELIYEYLMDNIPKGNKFVKWIKKEKSTKKKESVLIEKYDISKKEAEIYNIFEGK